MQAASLSSFCRASSGSCRQRLQVPKAAVSDEAATKARAEVTKRITELGRRGKPKEAINELTNLAKMGIQPDTQAATALLSACVANRNVDMAMNVFEELFGGFVEPDDVAFSVLIRGMGQSNPPDWTSIAQLLSRMQNEYDVPMSVNVYNALLELCAQSNDVTRAEELLDKMAGQGIEPNSFTQKAVENKRALRSALRRVFGSMDE